MNKKNIEAVIIVLAFLAGIFITKIDYGNNYMLSKGALKDSKMYIYNKTCNSIHINRTVNNTEFYNDVLSLCLKAKKFRPISSLEIVSGEQAEAVIYLQTESIQYLVCFQDVKSQMSIDNIHREKPLLSIGIANRDESGRYGTITSWYCYLTPEEYVSLYDLVARYSEGEFVGL